VVAPDDEDDDDERPTMLRDWSAEPPSAIQARPMRGVLLRLDTASPGMTLPLPDEPLRFGRGREAEARIDDEGVSRIHAEIRKTSDGYEIQDLASRNGTVVSGRRVTRVMLRDGDIIQLGPRVAFRFSFMDERQVAVMRQLFETSVRDGLTGAFNRRHLEDRLRGELAYAIRHSTELGVLLFDVDHFKRVNDTFGHDVGDLVLQRTAAALRTAIRTNDLVCRLGGEEFLLICEHTTLQDGVMLAERIRRSIAVNRIKAPGFEGAVTVSIGLAARTPDMSHPDELLKEADRAVYAAKNAGRNCVRNAGPTVAAVTRASSPSLAMRK
jgi:diguanylate cyclase (GGDEF)-like protein